MHDFAFIFAGFFVGIVVGLTGVGGGSLMTPILIFFFGVKPYLAVGTDLLFAAFTKMGGTVSLARQRLVPWRVVAHLCAGSIPAALLTLYVLHSVGPADPAVQRVMTTTLGCGAAADGGRHPVQGGARQAGSAFAARQSTGASHPPAPLGSAAGVRGRHRLSGHIDLGRRRRDRRHRAVAAVPVAAAAAHRRGRHRLCGAADTGGRAGPRFAGLGRLGPLLAKLLAGSLPGIWVGSHLMSRTPERLIRAVLSLLLAYAGTKLVLL